MINFKKGHYHYLFSFRFLTHTEPDLLTLKNLSARRRLSALHLL
jgi:hypothetical protein